MFSKYCIQLWWMSHVSFFHVNSDFKVFLCIIFWIKISPALPLKSCDSTHAMRRAFDSSARNAWNWTMMSLKLHALYYKLNRYESLHLWNKSHRYTQFCTMKTILRSKESISKTRKQLIILYWIIELSTVDILLKNRFMVYKYLLQENFSFMT